MKEKYDFGIIRIDSDKKNRTDLIILDSKHKSRHIIWADNQRWKRLLNSLFEIMRKFRSD